MFSGRPPVGHDVHLRFCCLASPCAPFFSAGSLLSTFWASFSMFFRVVGRMFRLWKACHAPFLHRGSTRAHIRASWRRQTTKSAANRVTKSISPYRLFGFRNLFLYFQVFRNYAMLRKNELPLGRELDFESTCRSNCNFVCLGPLPKNRSGFKGSCWRG